MSNVDVVRAMYEAYRSQDAAAADALLAPGLRFTSPQDDHIDKAAFMERCFPTAARFVSQDVLHLTAEDAGLQREADDESVFFAYEYRLATGDAYRNVELITVRGERIEEIQVFFGGRTN